MIKACFLRVNGVGIADYFEPSKNSSLRFKIKSIAKIVKDEFDWEVIKQLKTPLVNENIFFFRENINQETTIIFDVEQEFSNEAILSSISLEIIRVLKKRFQRDKKNGTLTMYFNQLLKEII